MKFSNYLATALAAALSGCWTVPMSFRSLDSESVYFSSVAGQNEGNYRDSETIGFLAWGLWPLNEPDPAKFLRRYIGNGRRIANFRAAVEMSPIDWLLGFLTFGIYAPLTAKYQWDVVHVAAKGASAPSPPSASTNTNTIIINPGAPVTVPGPAGSFAPPIGSGTGVTGSPVNPIITSLAANPPSVRPGQRIGVTIEAYSPAGRPLTISWSSSAGVLSATTGRIVYWTAPDQAGVYVVAVSVTDGAGGQGVGSVQVTVTP